MANRIPNRVFRSVAYICRVSNRAVAKAQEESRRLGVPNVNDINGHTYYEHPDGTLTLEDPWQGRNTPPAGGAPFDE